MRWLLILCSRPDLREVEDIHEESNNGIGEDKLSLEIHLYCGPENDGYDHPDDVTIEDMFRVGVYVYSNSKNQQSDNVENITIK